jgi:PPOX class probable F420-dependent enzyme
VAGATLSELPAWAAELLERTPVGHLGLLDEDGRPRVQPVTFARVGDAIYTAIDDKPKRTQEPARVRRLRANPSAALTVDRYDDDWDKLAWVQVLGDVTVLATEGHDDALAALAARYPAYRIKTPPGPLLRLMPSRVLWWRATTAPY